MKLNKLILYVGGIIAFLLGMLVFGIMSDFRNRELNELLKEKNIKDFKTAKIEINKIDYKLHLYMDTVLVKTYDVVFGGNPKYYKRSASDRYTPSGEYFICEKTEDGLYGNTLLLNYPNLKDATDGLRENIITKEEFNRIAAAVLAGTKPPMNTNLGGNIAIHGNGKYDFILRNLPFIINWTDGGIALDNSEIKELYNVCNIGTKVYIY